MTDTVAESVSSLTPATGSQAGVVIASRHSHEVDASAELTLANDKIQMGVLPAGHRLVDAILAADDLDSHGTPAVVLHLGTADDPDAIIASSNVARAGGIARMDAIAGAEIAATDSDLAIWVTCATPPATDQDGTLAVTLFYVPDYPE